MKAKTAAPTDAHNKVGHPNNDDDTDAKRTTAVASKPLLVAPLKIKTKQYLINQNNNNKTTTTLVSQSGLVQQVQQTAATAAPPDSPQLRKALTAAASRKALAKPVSATPLLTASLNSPPVANPVASNLASLANAAAAVAKQPPEEHPEDNVVDLSQGNSKRKQLAAFAAAELLSHQQNVSISSGGGSSSNASSGEASPPGSTGGAPPVIHSKVPHRSPTEVYANLLLQLRNAQAHINNGSRSLSPANPEPSPLHDIIHLSPKQQAQLAAAASVQQLQQPGQPKLSAAARKEKLRHQPSFQCPVCKKRFQRHIALNAHFQNEHIGNPSLVQSESKQCKLCTKLCPDIAAVRTHLHTHHGIDLENPSACLVDGDNHHYALSHSPLTGGSSPAVSKPGSPSPSSSSSPTPPPPPPPPPPASLVCSYQTGSKSGGITFKSPKYSILRATLSSPLDNHHRGSGAGNAGVAPAPSEADHSGGSTSSSGDITSSSPSPELRNTPQNLLIITSSGGAPSAPRGTTPPSSSSAPATLMEIKQEPVAAAAVNVGSQTSVVEEPPTANNEVAKDLTMKRPPPLVVVQSMAPASPPPATSSIASKNPSLVSLLKRGPPPPATEDSITRLVAAAAAASAPEKSTSVGLSNSKKRKYERKSAAGGSGGGGKQTPVEVPPAATEAPSGCAVPNLATLQAPPVPNGNGGGGGGGGAASSGTEVSNASVPDLMTTLTFPFRCQHCTIIFPNQTLYFLHRGFHSDGANPWRCNGCGHNCADMYDFNTHLMSDPHN